MEITALVQGKKPGLIRLFVNEEYKASITVDTIAQFGLYKGKVLEVNELETILKEDLSQKLYYRAVAQIGKRPRSENEMNQYLKTKIAMLVEDPSLSNKLLVDVMDKLRDRNYINDLDFTNWWIDNRLSFKGKSRVELQQELRLKGISSELVAQVLADKYNSTDEAELIRTIASKKVKGVNFNEIYKDKDKYRKLLSYLTRRGFSISAINSALRETDS